ncbi:MOSC domain-containing protein [Yinghuangia seranimata]|uniref:MOSC domain-containing protein n=1 Tax=Yinghuangia seranimata TaxID=408067 RepID=UPI00248B4AB7|nr:MOSC N-terminal beta barrel domain-containing protein [Yinghuangia seranimata]MDI2125774.1 MOSC N-terminal beta barrel domain-containing protein [Yinghuangia seranimata]
MATVVDLFTYPVKGCAGVPLRTAPVGAAGVAHDRTFIVVDENGVFRSQRTDPKLAVVRAAVEADGAKLVLSADGVEELRLGVDPDGERVAIEMFKQPYRGVDQGPDAAAWFTEVLGAPCRLMRVPPAAEHGRVTKGLLPGTAAFADGGAVTIASLASLRELNRRLAEADRPALPIGRFRPNIIVDGWDEPHAEDRARHIRVGGAELGFAKVAGRCVVTTVDQQRGVKAGPEPLRILATYRRGPEGGVLFASQYSVATPGTVTVGDDVTVTQWAEPEAPATD